MENIKTWGEALFEAKQDTLNYYFIEAVGKNDRQKAIDLLDAGADPNARGVLSQEWKDGKGCLHLLVKSSNTNATKDFIKELVERGADPNMTENQKGRTPLHFLIWDPRKWKFVDLLISLGADPNKMDKEGKSAVGLSLSEVERIGEYAYADDLKKIAKRLILGGGKGNPTQIYDVFKGDLSWWKNAPPDFMEKVNRINKTKSIFNV